MKRNPLVSMILGAIASIAVARDQFTKAIGAGGYRSSRYHYGRFRRGETTRGYSGAKLARMAQECRIGTPGGNTYVGAMITWPQSRAKAKKARATA